MTDHFYVDSGYVDSGYSVYIADPVINLPVTVEVSCTTHTPEIQFQSNVSVNVSLDISFTRIKKCDSNLLLIDAFNSGTISRIRDIQVTTDVIFTEMAAIGVISDYFINCETNTNLTANVHIISGGSSSLNCFSNLGILPYRLSKLDSLLDSSVDLTIGENRIRELSANLEAFASELSITDRTRDDRADLQVSTDLTAHNSRLKDFHITLEAFASELAHNDRISNDSAALSVSTDLVVHNTRLKDYSVNLEAFASTLTLNERVETAHSNMDSAFTITCVFDKLVGIHSDLSSSAEVTTTNYRIKTNTIGLSSSASLAITQDNIRDYRVVMEAFVTELFDFKHGVAAKSYTAGTTGMKVTGVPYAQQIKDSKSNLLVDANQATTGIVTKALTSQLAINASITAHPVKLKDISSSLTTDTTIIASVDKSAEFKSPQVVEFSLVNTNTRVRTAQIHTDVIATELAAIAKIGDFFINCDLNTIMVCKAQTIAKARSDLLVEASQSTKGVKSSDNKSSCNVNVSSSIRNIRVSSGISSLISSIQLNTNVSKISAFNSVCTAFYSFNTSAKRVRESHSQLLTDISINAKLIKQKLARSSMSTIVTCGSAFSKTSINSSHLNVTAESVVWANRLKETLVDIHFAAEMAANISKFSSVKIEPLNVDVNISAYGHLFYLDLRYGWMIANENRDYSIKSDLNEFMIERENRTFTIGI